jgi:DNA-binding MarR family transcriptional regulator
VTAMGTEQRGGERGGSATVGTESTPTLSTDLASDSAARLRAVIGKLSRRLRPTVAASGLTPSQVSVLFTVVRLGPLGLSELAEIEAMNPTMVSRIIVQLCDAGLIQRKSRQDDRRAAIVTATAAGRRVRERVHNERTQALSTYLATVDEDQLGLLWAALPVLEDLAERIGDRRR